MDSKLKCVFALPPGQEQNNLEEKMEPGYDNARSQVAATPAQAEVKVRFRLENIPNYWLCFSYHTQPYSMKVMIIS